MNSEYLEYCTEGKTHKTTEESLKKPSLWLDEGICESREHEMLKFSSFVFKNFKYIVPGACFL